LLRFARNDGDAGTKAAKPTLIKQHQETAMAPRAFWKGYLRLSLVTCPIELYPATSQAEKTHFHQINRKTGNRLRQQMVDEETGKVVDKDDKGRGYELSKGRYVEIEEDELEAVQVESTHTIDIDSFVPAEEIDERYRDRPYYVVPDGKVGADAFAVIRDAMKEKERVGLARIVIAHREHMVALEPLGKGIVATTLRYDYEMRDENQFFKEIATPKVSKDMLELAGHILETKAAHFDPGKFKDQYEIALRKLVERKAAGKKIEPAVRPEKPDNVINLMDALRQSLGGKHARGAAPARGRRSGRHAPRHSRKRKAA
jgi:DNA end-binding protein Ku